MLTSVKDFICQTKHFCGLYSLEAVGLQPLNEIDSSGPGHLDFRARAISPQQEQEREHVLRSTTSVLTLPLAQRCWEMFPIENAVHT